MLRTLGPVCPHCGSVAPFGDARIAWFAAHIDNTLHHWWWAVRRVFGKGYTG